MAEIIQSLYDLLGFSDIEVLDFGSLFPVLIRVVLIVFSISIVLRFLGFLASSLFGVFRR